MIAKYFQERALYIGKENKLPRNHKQMVEAVRKAGFCGNMEQKNSKRPETVSGVKTWRFTLLLGPSVDHTSFQAYLPHFKLRRYA